MQRLLLLLTSLILTLATMTQAQDRPFRSYLQVFDLNTLAVDTVYQSDDHFEAPNWSRDGKFLMFNQGGHLQKLWLESGEVEEIDTGFADNCNNDHGISPDGTLIVISHNLPETDDHPGGSSIYTLPIEGGEPQPVTELTPSYWHGWSPDGETLAYVAERGGQYDIYTIPVDGGEETQLTNSPGLDDGPDYSPDGRYIYYNSFASGRMELWRMDADGGHPVQLTDDPYSNWFPHPSPDGNYLVFIAYQEDQGQAHPAMKRVALRLYDLRNDKIATLREFRGGQGTINVPSWSPDSKRFAFVSYVYR